MRRLTLLLLLSLLIFTSCKDREAILLKERVHSQYSANPSGEKLSSGSKVQYIEIERSISKKYVEALEGLVDSAFESQLQRFEDEQLGVWGSYSNMFSWLFSSRQAWDDKMRLLSQRYFTTLDINQQQHELYMQYVSEISSIRQQFISSSNLPVYTQLELPSSNISLDFLAEHSRNNLIIEFGTEIFSWLLAFIIIQLVLLFVDKIAGGWGCLIDIVVFATILVASVVMTSINDTKLIDSLKSQYSISEQRYNSEAIIESLNHNTETFYENL